VNTIRVYNVDPTLNHDECASIFNGVGIYMVIDVNSPLGGESINRADPKSSYHVGYLSRIFGVVENFKGYPNTLGFCESCPRKIPSDTIANCTVTFSWGK
jgi:hypothetical protein